MNKITNANMFNWSKKKQKYETDEPKVQRKRSFSLTDTLRRSVIKAKFKESKEDLSTKSKEDINTKPPRPQPPKNNTQLSNGSAPLAKPEETNLTNEISQITLQVSQMTADAQLIAENIKIGDEKVTHNKNAELPIENNENELYKVELQKSDRISEDSPVYANVNFETNETNLPVSKITVENAELSKEELNVYNGSVPHHKDLESASENNTDELNKEEDEKSERISQDDPVYVNVNFETTQLNPQLSTVTVEDVKLDMEKLKTEDESVLHNNNQESHLDKNEDELNKEEVQEAKTESLDKPEDANVEIVDSKNTKLTPEVSQITADAQLIIEESKRDDENVLYNNDQTSLLGNNDDVSNKEDKPEDVHVEIVDSKNTKLTPEVSQITADAQLIIEEPKGDDENVLCNNDQASPIENNDDVSNKEEIQKSKRISQSNLEDIDINDGTTQLTVQVSQTSAEESQISIEALKINDESIIHNKELESPLEVNEDESNKTDIRKSRRISQISVEKEDIALCKKEDFILYDDETNSNASDNGITRRNSTIRRSIKLELTIIESPRTSPEKESTRYSLRGSQTDYPEELNPFAEEEDEDEVSLVKSENQNSNNHHYNPFDSESESEDPVKDENKEISRNTSHNNSCTVTTRNKNQETSKDKTYSQEESKYNELPGGSLPPSPKAPARRRLPQTKSLQCLNEYSDPTKKIWQNKKSSSTLSKSNTQSDNHISSSTLEEKGEDFINSEDNLNMDGKPTQLPKSSISIHTTSSGISSAGSNPFDDDDDENEQEETSKINKPKLDVETQKMRSSSPSLSLNESALSVHSTPSKSLNPFEEDEEDDEFESATEFRMMRGASSRSSIAISPSNTSSFKRDTGIRGSLPPSRRPGVKKRLAPLPPGQLPPTTPDKKGNNYQINGSLSSSSPRKVPPPRPPPPRVQKIS